jgi:hypothetical protein
MSEQEHRSHQRFRLNFPFSLSCIDKAGELLEFHNSRILDAGAGGMRVEVPEGKSLTKGSELVLHCLPYQDTVSDMDSYPVAIHVEVVWNEPDSQEVGFAYRK